jgi:molecular chaperone GrpE
MTEKKHHTHQNHQGSDASEPLEAPESGALFAASSPAQTESADRDIHELEAKLADAEAKSAENLDGWQRAVAEFQNFKKRMERDRETDQAAMKADLIRKVLPILDDLERALQSRPPEDAWFNGIELIQRKLQSVLEAEGVKRIEAEGADFDPNFHEAISQEPVDGAESGRVVEVVLNGYMLGDRVVRPAQVKVAK